jgi:hypothetical protein
VATRPERRPRGQDRRGAAGCRPVFPLRDWHRGDKSTLPVRACTLPYLPTPVAPFHAEPSQTENPAERSREKAKERLRGVGACGRPIHLRGQRLPILLQRGARASSLA